MSRIPADASRKSVLERIERAGDLRLVTLDLSGLGLAVVPDSVRLLTWLRTLVLQSNRLTELPPWIGELPLLERLDVSGNHLISLPPQIIRLTRLRELILDNNSLETLPPQLDAMALNVLSLSNNRDLGLPDSVSQSGEPSEILRYYYESRAGKAEALRELKIIVVGRGGAGKTTLVKALAGDPLDPQEPETHSIIIRTLPIRCQSGHVTGRVWDFGGQEILHATHQFFLTERSLYLVVLEPRSGMAQRDAEYWLELIRTQGATSPTIVVLNKSHDRFWNVDKVKLARKYTFVYEFVSTDALAAEGVDSLRDTIANAVETKMPDVWIRFPRRWRKIKDAVARMQVNFLTYERFCELCTANDITDSAAQADLAGILHRLGIALYFGRDPRLHDTRVLNPRWVTGGVYAVIRSRAIRARDGHLLVDDMPSVLREAEKAGAVIADDYPFETHRFILDLMCAFQLAYASEERINFRPTYLVPELLPEFEPQMSEQWEVAPVRLRYRYSLLPPGLLPRFVVQTHSLSEGAPHWRYGVVLRHADAVALIRVEPDQHELDVFVTGGDEESRRVLVGMVRSELQALHANMKTQPVEELQLSGVEQHWISVKSLSEVEDPSSLEPQRLPVQPEGTMDVDVDAELNKLLPSDARIARRNAAAVETPVRLFVSYAHDDERFLKRLDAMLDVLEYYHNLTAWRDKRLIAGDVWESEIRRRLDEADIIIFVASAVLLARPYIRHHELRRAKERYAAREVEVLTVKLEPCACDEDPFLGKLQRLGPKLRSIAEAPLRSAAWEQVRRDLLPVIARARQRKSTDIGTARH